MMIIYTVLVVTITILVQAVWKWTHKEEHLGLEVRPRKGLGCGLAPPPDEIPGDAQPVAGRRVEVRPRKDLGCGLPSRLEVRPVEETGCGLASPLGENQEGLPSDAQLSAGRRLEVRPVGRRGADSPHHLERIRKVSQVMPGLIPEGGLRYVPGKTWGVDSPRGLRCVPWRRRGADSPRRSREGKTYPRAMPGLIPEGGLRYVPGKTWGVDSPRGLRCVP